MFIILMTSLFTEMAATSARISQSDEEVAVQCQICMEYEPYLNDRSVWRRAHMYYVEIVFSISLKSRLLISHVLHAGTWLVTDIVFSF